MKPEQPRPRNSVAIYFFAGNFGAVLQRHAEGRQQVYGTHSEVARLCHELADAGVTVHVASFMTDSARVTQFGDRIWVHDLGARRWNDDAVLTRSVAAIGADLLIAHIANPALIQACARSGKPAIAVMATSFNRSGIGPWLQRLQLKRALNRPEIELASNHCRPATEQLARMGVDRGKLVAWDIPHEFQPAGRAPKALALDQGHCELFYAGSVTEAKGCFEIVRAVHLLRGRGIAVNATFAGSGDVEGVQSLADELGIADHVLLLGNIENGQVMDRYTRSTIAVVPSRHEFPEGFPLTMFEAIASRTPIVCSDHPVFMPVMTHGETAMVFQERNPAHLADAVAQILGDAALYERLSANADIAWARLQGPTDWRTMLRNWVLTGRRP